MQSLVNSLPPKMESLPWKRHACLGFIGFAFTVTAYAQSSSVSLYGLLDVGVRLGTDAAGQKKSSGALSSETTLISGGMSNSYFGIKGKDNLGDGLVTEFDLESGFMPTTGASQQKSAFFDRRAAVGLGSDDWGMLYFGRNTTFAYDQAASGVLDPLQRAYNSVNQSSIAYGSGKSGSIGGVIAARVNPSNTLISSAFASDRNNAMLKYNVRAGAWAFGLSYADNRSGFSNAHATGAAVNYTGGNLIFGMSLQNNVDATGQHADLYGLGVRYNLNDSISVQAGFQSMFADDQYNANTVAPLETVDTTGAIGLVSKANGRDAKDQIRVGDVALTYAATADWKFTLALFRTSLTGNLTPDGSNNSAILVAKYMLSKNSLLYAGIDQSLSNGSLRGVNTDGRNVGLTSGIQLRF